jgi:flagellar hook assembly protein FlgD
VGREASKGIDMKKVVMPLIVLLLFGTLLLAEVLNSSNLGQALLARLFTPGTASFGVRTVTYNGNYAPQNAGVIWVTDSNNQFVKTIKIWASSYRYTLIRWIASSSQNMTGAITSASLNNHQLHNVQWDGYNWQNSPMPDGEYKFNIEFTEHNASASNLGKFKQVVFAKGSEPVDLTIPNETYFRDMSLAWEPIIEDGTISGRVSFMGSGPIPGALLTAGDQSSTTNAMGDYSLSLAPGQYTLTCTATGYHPYTVNDVTVISGEDTTVDIELAVVSLIDPNHVPSALIMAAPYPNPSKTGTKISFYPAQDGDYELQIFNKRGQIVCHTSGYATGQAWKEISWDGRDSLLRECPSGLYFVKLRSGNQQRIQKVSLSR